MQRVLRIHLLALEQERSRGSNYSPLSVLTNAFTESSDSLRISDAAVCRHARVIPECVPMNGGEYHHGLARSTFTIAARGRSQRPLHLFIYSPTKQRPISRHSAFTPELNRQPDTNA